MRRLDSEERRRQLGQLHGGRCAESGKFNFVFSLSHLQRPFKGFQRPSEAFWSFSSHFTNFPFRTRWTACSKRCRRAGATARISRRTPKPGTTLAQRNTVHFTHSHSCDLCEGTDGVQKVGTALQRFEHPLRVCSWAHNVSKVHEQKNLSFVHSSLIKAMAY